MDAIVSIHETTGINKRFDASLLTYNLPNITYPSLCFNIREKHILDEINARILCRDMIDGEDDIKVVSDMCVLNSIGNREGVMFVIFWKSAARVIEMDGSVYHRRCHDANDIETTTNFQYAPAINSIFHIIKATIKLLEETDQNKVGVDFYVTSTSTVILKLSPSHKNNRSSDRYGGALPFKKQLISR